MAITDQIKQLKESSKKRNFSQRYDLIISLKDFDPNKADNKLDEILVLPKETGKPTSITVFVEHSRKIEGCKVISMTDIEGLAQKKLELKKLIKTTSLFLAEPKLMPVVGKHLGKFLAPIGKMPKPVMGDLEKMVKEYKNSVRLSVKKQPMIQVTIGSDKMKDEDVAENIQAVVNFLISKLPKGRNNLDTIYLKFTMSHPIKLEVK